MELDGMRMTCIVPAGRRTFLPHVPDADFHALLAAYKSSIDKGTTTGNEAQNTGPEENVDVSGTEKPSDLEAETNENLQADVDEDQEPQRLRKRSSETSIGPRKKQQLHAPADESTASEEHVHTEETQAAVPESQEVEDGIPKNKDGDKSLDSGPPETPTRTTRGRARTRKDSLVGTQQQAGSNAGNQEQSSGNPTGLSVEVRNSQPAGKSGFVSVTIDNTTKPNPRGENENDPQSTDSPESKESPIAEPIGKENPDERKLEIEVAANPETAPQPAEDEKVLPEQPPPFTLSPLTLGGVEVVILMDILGATNLENKLIKLDGRVEDIPNGNAWKEFRCYRNNQDMGSLWEVRQAWYVKQK